MKLLAFHLPQFHPIPENDAWWGAGFTEWRNVAKARPLFPGHRQPLQPGELGFYDLRLPEVLCQQAELARYAGVDGFCFYHYWFAGRMVLERPIELLRECADIDLPYCLCWANHSWTGHWAGRSDDVLLEQTYPGREDDRRHYDYLRKHFADERYLKVRGAPIFVVFKPEAVPHLKEMCSALRGWARSDGHAGLYLIGLSDDRSYVDDGVLDAIAPHGLNDMLRSYLTPLTRARLLLQSKLFRWPKWVIRYEKLVRNSKNHMYDGRSVIPTVIPNWDNTPRIGVRGLVLSGASPSSFGDHLRHSSRSIERAGGDGVFMFVKSWNEWAEGNHLEPDSRWGRGWLDAVRKFRTEEGL